MRCSVSVACERHRRDWVSGEGRDVTFHKISTKATYKRWFYLKVVAGVFLVQTVPHLMTLKPNCSWWQNLSLNVRLQDQRDPLSRVWGQCPLAVWAPHSLTAETTTHPHVTKSNLLFYPHHTEHEQVVLPTEQEFDRNVKAFDRESHLAQTHKLPVWDRVRHRKLPCTVELHQYEIWGGSVTYRSPLDVQRSFFLFKLLLYGSD